MARGELFARFAGSLGRLPVFQNGFVRRVSGRRRTPSALNWDAHGYLREVTSARHELLNHTSRLGPTFPRKLDIPSGRGNSRRTRCRLVHRFPISLAAPRVYRVASINCAVVRK